VINIDELAGRTGEWLRGTGPENDIVVSSRIRLARNVAARPFLTVASHKAKAELEAMIREGLEGVISGRRGCT
jgi:protein arginine kinase